MDNMSKYFSKDYELDKDTLKTLLYATLFCLGVIPTSSHSNVFREVNKSIGDYTLTKEVLLEWNDRVQLLVPHFDNLVDILWAEGVDTIKGRSVYNAMESPFFVKGATSTTMLNKKQRRQLLAHIVQGIESEAVIINVLNNPSQRISSLEHDGFVAMNYIDWVHPYLKVDIKHVKPLDIP